VSLIAAGDSRLASDAGHTIGISTCSR
jgi:hypothetical protein